MVLYLVLINLDYRSPACGRLLLGHGLSSFRFCIGGALHYQILEVAMAQLCERYFTLSSSSHVIAVVGDYFSLKDWEMFEKKGRVAGWGKIM